VQETVPLSHSTTQAFLNKLNSEYAFYFLVREYTKKLLKGLNHMDSTESPKEVMQENTGKCSRSYSDSDTLEAKRRRRAIFTSSPASPRSSTPVSDAPARDRDQTPTVLRGGVMDKKSNFLSAWRPWWCGVLVAICGLMVGVLTFVGQGKLPGSWQHIANSGAVWLVPVFFIGSLMPTDKSAAASGIGTLAGTLVGYYGTAALALGFPPDFYYTAFWVGMAIISGPMLGVAGHWWRSERLSRRVVAIALLGGIFISEGLYLFWNITAFWVGPTGWGWIVIGILIPLILGHSVKDRLFALSALPLVVLLGIAAYQAITWITNIIAQLPR
jgi:hypothetical protein